MQNYSFHWTTYLLLSLESPLLLSSVSLESLELVLLLLLDDFVESESVLDDDDDELLLSSSPLEVLGCGGSRIAKSDWNCAPPLVASAG